MSSSNILGKYGIAIITVLLALIVTRFGVSYLIVLIAIGFILALITKSKLYAVSTGVVYTIISYILSYPAGLFLIEYMPTTNETIQVSTMEVGINLLMGVLIPTIVTIVLCGISAIIGSLIVEYLNKGTSNNNTKEEHHFQVIDNFNESRKKHKERKRIEKKKIYETPIQKAKDRKNKQKKQ